LIALEMHRAVFTWVLQCLGGAGLVKGKTVGVDATMLEANAALRSIVRRDTGEGYEEFLSRLAKASGIGTPTRADLARLDRLRRKKGSNAEWTHPHDSDARITKMKDGRTHLAHKAEHAIDLEKGAIVALTVQGADQGDRATIQQTLPEAAEQLEAVADIADDVTWHDVSHTQRSEDGPCLKSSLVPRAASVVSLTVLYNDAVLEDRGGGGSLHSDIRAV
jgi:transposase